MGGDRPLPGRLARGDSRSFPNAGYYTAFGDFYDGNYKSALAQFKGEKNFGIHSAQGPWIDSICYETMMGECLYELGDLSEALQHYTQALELVKAFPDWMLRVQFPAIQPAGASLRRAIPWGAQHAGGKTGAPFPGP